MALEDDPPPGPLGLFLGFWQDETVVIRSPLAPAEALTALSGQVDPLFTLFGKRPARGHVGAGGGWIRRRISGRNSAQSVLRFEVEPEGSGSRIACHIGASWFSRGFLIFWMGGIILSSGRATLSSLSSGQYLVPAVLSGMLLFGGLLVVFGRWLARGDKPFLVDLVVGTVDGRVERPRG